ncbi:hypothetical protein ACNQ2Q_26140, partial [Enterobacter cloacae complex sp.6701430]|uniref:hypothetical protein n=1 Tax=Enterobacter cloacae complex sp.6701430 TaxID=3397176 RepID=UPI003AAC1D8C
DQAGAQVTHVFIDDSDKENAFNYRAINALLVAVNYQATGVLDLLQVMPQLLNQKLAIQVKKFEESTYKDSNGVDRTAYNPKVNDLSPWMPKGSVVDQSIAKPEVSKPNTQQGGFGGQGGFGSPAPQSQGGFGGAPLPP